MRQHGTHLGVDYKLVRYCVRHLAYEYRVISMHGPETIYVLDMRDLKEQLMGMVRRLSLADEF